MIDPNKASRLEFWPSREWLARNLSDPNRDRELWDCAAKMKSSCKTTVYSFIRERCDRLGGLFHWRLYHIEVLQRLSRTYLPGDSQNDPLVLLIFCAKSSSDDIGRRGMHMRGSMEGLAEIRPLPPSSRSSGRDRDDRIVKIGGGIRGRARERHRPRLYSDDTFVHYPPRRHRMGNEIKKSLSETKQSHAKSSKSDDHYECYVPPRHRMESEINKRPSETKQSDAEIIDQILREYTTYGDSNAIPSPIEQASMNGRANAADGTSDAASRFGGDVAEDPPSRD